MPEIPTTEQSVIQVQLILVKFYFGNILFVRAKHKGSITNTQYLKFTKSYKLYFFTKKFTGEM